jgi:hypothetical protein
VGVVSQPGGASARDGLALSATKAGFVAAGLIAAPGFVPEACLEPGDG